jgi:thioredoxin 1
MALAVNQLTFNREVIDSAIPVLVGFWAPWCGVCRLVNPMLGDLKAEWGDQIKLVSINADENLRLTNRYRITTLPTVILFDRGQLLCRFEQFRGRDDFRHASLDLATLLQQLAQPYSYSA